MKPFFVSMFAVVLLATSPALAQQPHSAEDLRAAAEVYDSAINHYTRRDFEVAAGLFEVAHRTTPSHFALMGAVRSHRLAGGTAHLARAATLALQLQARYSQQRQALQLARTTLNELRPQVGQVRVQCEQCELTVDETLYVDREFFVAPGEHTFVASWSERRTDSRVERLSAGQQLTLTFETPPRPPPAAPPPPLQLPPPPPPSPGVRVLHPAIAISGLGTALGLGVAAIALWSWSTQEADALLRAANDARNANRIRLEYDMLVYRERNLVPAETATTALLLSSVTLGTLSAVTAAVFTRWRPAPAASTDSARNTPFLVPGTGLTVRF